MNTASALQRVLVRPWLRPSAAALAALADDRPNADVLRYDPGLVLHALRFVRPHADADTFTLDSDLLVHPHLAHYAAELLARDTEPSVVVVDSVCLGRAWAASEEAKRSERCSPDAAWAAGLISGLFAGDPQTGRKALARWRLPEWLTIAVGHPELTVEEATAIGGHPGLLRVLHATTDGAVADSPVLSAAENESQAQFPLLVLLLRATAKNRLRADTGLVRELEGRIDRLSAALARQTADFDRAVRDAKLDGLAEFAAGASHEINNPLAVISTNVQLLRSEEDDPARLDRYDAVLRQTNRIHELLAGSRQFARPPKVNATWVPVSAWVTAVADQYDAEATARGVTLELPAESTTGRVWADAAQLRLAVGHLVKNSIEAAGPDGWVRVCFESGKSTSRIVVEDSGPGPTSAAVPHLFDPFYSNRKAGRGRGLGLPIAWRLAKVNGGDCRYEMSHVGPTRFVLTLPATPAEYSVPGRKSA